MTTISFSQNVIKGFVMDANTNEAIIGANVIIEGTAEGTITDWDGSFEFESSASYPFNLAISYIGYSDKLFEVVESKKVKIMLEETSTIMEEVVVTGSRISEENKKSPLTVESLDVLAIKNTPASNFYEGLGSLKGVDMTTASLGFQIINTRGFNSTSPVRSLQTIDGVDNQAPGLNFSLGNFLGSSELDVLKVDIIVGACSAFCGPNAFNGAINMQTKNPFFMKGLSGSVKIGERNLKKIAARYADAFKNKDGNDWMAFKLNMQFFDADDWEANNLSAVSDSESTVDNPGGYDAVNVYGDEYRTLFDQTSASPWLPSKGQGIYYRTGYAEEDLLQYKTRNLKTNAALHFRLNPSAEYESPEFIIATSFSNGTTIYQGENRFALRDITFFQQRLELKKQDKYFIRAYMTKDNAGNSYDPYFTALELQQASKSDGQWNSAYRRYWQETIVPRMDEMGYPQLFQVFDENGDPVRDEQGFLLFDFDYEALEVWNEENKESLELWHQEANDFANVADAAFEENTQNFFVPGTPEFQEAFDQITSTPSGQLVEGTTMVGTKLVDRSALYHLTGEYNFEPEFLNFLRVGASARLYRPQSEGTIFVDSFNMDGVQQKISNFEYGVYTGAERKLTDDLSLSATVRVDKNQNYDFLVSPAASLVYTPSENNFLRVSFSSAIRNPTLSDQYLDFDVGPATLRGNLNGVEDLITIESFQDYRRNLFDQENRPVLDTFNISPIRPEKVKTAEVGYRTTLYEKLYVDASYYYSIYDDFIGYNIGLKVGLSQGFPTGVKAFRYSANSLNRVTTQGFSIGLNYFVGSYYKIGGNYSWNKLNTQIDDPIVPAFNTPEHKFNLGFSGRKMPLSLGGANTNHIGFGINYKWIQGFIFEGSPQFTGAIEDYGLLDVQVSYEIPKISTTFKIGSSNILNNKVYQTYGGPLVGRLAYISFLYDFAKKD